MFALSYNPPVKPDPYKRDPYFDGQELGFKQMAEVAADRNQKRQIELNRQNLQLQRQQEARVARQQQENLELARRQQVLKEKLLPLEMAGLNAKAAKDLAEADYARESLNKTPDYVARGQAIQAAATTPTSIDNSQSTRAMEGLSTTKQEERPTATTSQQMERIETRDLETEMDKIGSIRQSFSALSDPLSAAKFLIENIGGVPKPIARAEEQARKERENAAQREATLRGQTTKEARGFGLSNNDFGISSQGIEDFFYEYNNA